jgi:hypothetical protein
VRYGLVLIAVALTAIGASVAAEPVAATYPGPGPTVGCSGSAGGISFGGTCVAVQGPSAPTRPARTHPWILSAPVAVAACTPYTVTQWATGTSKEGWSWDGSFWTEAGQRVPILYSTPIQDNGWMWTVSCGSPGAVRYTGAASKPRSPSPCSPGVRPANCSPGLDPSSLLDSVEKDLPLETLTATPPPPGVVGVPVTVTIYPVPTAQYATVNATAPDLGDGDPGELLHVVWVVEAVPAATTWFWPDGTSGTELPWIPQVARAQGIIRAVVTYAVTASGFWSDGVSVHPLATVTVGSLTVQASLPYPVQQVQADLG